jgi:hypothetical protein
MIPNRSSRSTSRLAIAIALVFALALAGCSGDAGGDTQLSNGDLRPNTDEGAPSDPDQPPELLADKEIPTACANDLGTGDPTFEAAFCAYREAALAATSGPDGVAGIDTSLLSAGDEAVALYPSDPAGALALLESATAGLAG